jgi:hypothetical protein
METETETAQATTFGPPDADYDGIADAPDIAFEEQDDDDDIETPDDGEPDDLA